MTDIQAIATAAVEELNAAEQDALKEKFTTVERRRRELIKEMSEAQAKADRRAKLCQAQIDEIDVAVTKAVAGEVAALDALPFM